jgi:hypothetical protein
MAVSDWNSLAAVRKYYRTLWGQARVMPNFRWRVASYREAPQLSGLFTDTALPKDANWTITAVDSEAPALPLLDGAGPRIRRPTGRRSCRVWKARAVP